MPRQPARCPLCKERNFEGLFKVGKAEGCRACWMESRAGTLMRGACYPVDPPRAMTTEELARSLGVIQGDERLLDQVPGCAPAGVFEGDEDGAAP